MVFVAGHHIKRHIGLSLLHHIKQIFDKPLENINILCDADIIHSLGMVRAKPGSHSPGKQHCANLSLPDRFQSLFFIFLMLRFDLRQLHGCKGRDLSPDGSALMILHGSQDSEIRILYLGKQKLLLLLCQFLIISKNMLLPCPVQLFLCLIKIHGSFLSFCFQICLST